LKSTVAVASLVLIQLSLAVFLYIPKWHPYSTSQNFTFFPPGTNSTRWLLESDAAAVSPAVVVTGVAGMVCCEVTVVVVVGAEAVY